MDSGLILAVLLRSKSPIITNLIHENLRTLTVYTIFTKRSFPYSKPGMKKYTVLILAFLFITSAYSYSQGVILQQSCEDNFINKQVDSLKQLYSKDGYVLLKEASIAMESEFEMPVIVPLTQGSWYQFVFIGDYTSRLYEVRMFDWSEKQVIYQQKKWGDIDGNIISYSYIPQFSEFHMMKPVQINKKKKKNLCGYVMLFKKGAPQSSNGSITAGE